MTSKCLQIVCRRKIFIQFLACVDGFVFVKCEPQRTSVLNSGEMGLAIWFKGDFAVENASYG